MRGWLGKMCQMVYGNGAFPADIRQIQELIRAKAVQLSVLKQFAEETQNPELLEHVKQREVSLQRLEDEAWLLSRNRGNEGGESDGI